MINVLQNWSEIGLAVKHLESLRLPRHRSTEKCWDLNLLLQLANPLDRSLPVLDMGCSGLNTLHFLCELGFQNLTGIDLAPTLLDRLRQFRFTRQKHRWSPPYKILKGDMTCTGLAADHFALLTCISVIEHGVPFDPFLREAARLLQPGGILFLTADYWQHPIPADSAVREFNLPWQILNPSHIQNLIDLAQNNNLRLLQPSPIPPCGQTTACWLGKEYTFIALAFTKSA